MYRYVRNCCSVFGVRKNSVGWESGPLQQLVVALPKAAQQKWGGGQENLLLRATYFVRLLQWGHKQSWEAQSSPNRFALLGDQIEVSPEPDLADLMNVCC